MPNKTISVPDDVVPIIKSLNMPFSSWVTEQLRLHAVAHAGRSFAAQLLVDSEMAGQPKPTRAESREAFDRMERSAPW